MRLGLDPFDEADEGQDLPGWAVVLFVVLVIIGCLPLFV